MDLTQAETRIAEWEKTLSTIERQELNLLISKRKEAQKKVDDHRKYLEEALHDYRNECDGLIAAAVIIPLTSYLSESFDTLKSCIDKEVEFFPESLRCTRKAEFGRIIDGGSLGTVLCLYNMETASEALWESPRDYKNSSKLTYTASK